MTDMTRTEGFRIRGWHVLAAVVAFFGVVVAVDMTFVMAAYRSYPGQVSVTPYEDGLAYNKHMAQQRAQATLGWRASIATEPDKVVVAVLDAGGAPVTGLKVTGLLSRPATEAGRLSLVFAETSPGRYIAHAAPQAGAWDLAFNAQGQGEARLEGEKRLIWP